MQWLCWWTFLLNNPPFQPCRVHSCLSFITHTVLLPSQLSKLGQIPLLQSSKALQNIDLQNLCNSSNGRCPKTRKDWGEIYRWPSLLWMRKPNKSTFSLMWKVMQMKLLIRIGVEPRAVDKVMPWFINFQKNPSYGPGAGNSCFSPACSTDANFFSSLAFSHLGVGKMPNFQTQEGKFLCVSFILTLSSNHTLDSVVKCFHSVSLLDADISQILKYHIIGIGKNITLRCSQVMDCNKNCWY